MSPPRDSGTTATNFIDYETFQTGINALCEVWTSLDGEGTGTWEDVKLLKSVCHQTRISILSGLSPDFSIVKA
jgi:hypothetical protein